VLEALDAAVSVAPLGSEELLFANKLYRLWFGNAHHGHLQLVAQAGVPERRPGRSAGRCGLVHGPAHRHADRAQTENAEIFLPSWANGWRCARAT
jgi:hypothetical protein